VTSSKELWPGWSSRAHEEESGARTGEGAGTLPGPGRRPQGEIDSEDAKAGPPAAAGNTATSRPRRLSKRRLPDTARV